MGEGTYRFFYESERKIYDINLKSRKYREVEIRFNEEELSDDSEWLAYSASENAFYSLPDFLDGKVVGNAFGRERQLAAYQKIIANSDGSCGQKVHQAIMKKTI